MRRFLLALIPCALLLLPGCLEPSQERAKRDMLVGQASIAEAAVSVDHGLAVVNALSPGHLELWAAAPLLSIRLNTAASAPRLWTIDAHNVTPDARLVASSNDRTFHVHDAVSLGPTHKRWTVELPPSSDALVVLAPETDNQTSDFSFAVLSDIQEGVENVQDVFARINQHPELAFVLTAGDLTRRGKTQEMARVQRELETLSIPMYGTLGNHDIFEEPTPWHDYFGRCSHQFFYHGVAFTSLDSASATLDPMVYDWLDGWLANANDRLHVVVTHIPILDPIGVRSGGFANRNEAGKLLARLAAGRVDALFFGHIHSYYAFESAGIPSYISGGGGAIPERFDGIGRHFLVVSASPQRGSLSVTRVDVD